jgi:AcrR family transcriptional regulator
VSRTSSKPAARSEDATLREQLLNAAIEEFAEHGLSGARVDRIAQRAGANKQLIYYYFTDKSGLFDAAIQQMATRFTEVRGSLPIDADRRPAAYFEAAARDRSYIKMLQWEALSIGEGEAVEEKARAAHMRQAVDALRADQRAGRVPADLDPAQLFLSFQALAAHPFAFTQMTRFITGKNPSDPAFQRERVKFLTRLGARIMRVG